MFSAIMPTPCRIMGYKSLQIDGNNISVFFLSLSMCRRKIMRSVERISVLLSFSEID